MPQNLVHGDKREEENDSDEDFNPDENAVEKRAREAQKEVKALQAEAAKNEQAAAEKATQNQIEILTNQVATLQAVLQSGAKDKKDKTIGKGKTEGPLTLQQLAKKFRDVALIFGSDKTGLVDLGLNQLLEDKQVAQMLGDYPAMAGYIFEMFYNVTWVTLAGKLRILLADPNAMRTMERVFQSGRSADR